MALGLDAQGDIEDLARRDPGVAAVAEAMAHPGREVELPATNDRTRATMIFQPAEDEQEEGEDEAEGDSYGPETGEGFVEDDVDPETGEVFDDDPLGLGMPA